MNSKINVILIFCVAFMPYFLQCQDHETSSSSLRGPTDQDNCEIKEEEIAEESKNVKKNDENYECEIKEEVKSEESIHDVANIVAECEIKEEEIAEESKQVKNIDENDETLAEQDELCEAFTFVNNNNDGAISCGELKLVFGMLGREKPDEEIKSMILAAAKDGKAVKIDEFKNLMTSDTYVVVDFVMLSFSVIDANEDGVISPEDLVHFMKLVGDDFSLDHANKAMEGYGKNMEMDFEDFKKFLQSLQPPTLPIYY